MNDLWFAGEHSGIQHIRHVLDFKVTEVSKGAHANGNDLGQRGGQEVEVEDAEEAQERAISTDRENILKL